MSRVIDAKDVQKFKRVCEQYCKDCLLTPEKARETLVRLGIHNPDGSLHENYK